MKNKTKDMLAVWPIAEILVIGVLIVVISVGGWMAYKGWTTGGSEDDYEIICLGGHQYYRANFAQKALLGIRLTDDGKPIKCDREQS